MNEHRKPYWFRTLVLFLGVLSCLTLVGVIWGVPMIGWALDRDWEIS